MQFLFINETGQGHQIFKVAPKHDISNQYGGAFGLGPSKGDDDDNWLGDQAAEEVLALALPFSLSLCLPQSHSASAKGDGDDSSVGNQAASRPAASGC